MGADWSGVDFDARLDTGKKWERRVRDRLREAGVEAQLGPEGSHGFDVYAAGEVVEVKSRDVRFWRDGAGDYPFPTVFVDPVDAWARKPNAPRAIVLVSQITGAMAALSVPLTRDEWVVETPWDRKLNCRRPSLAAPRHLWRPFRALVRALRGD